MSSTENGNSGGEERERFSGRIAFYLAAIGSAVGFGNVWRFPQLAADFGGGAFLIPYILCLFLIGIPILFLELALGQYFQAGAVGSFGGIHARLRGVGLGSVMCSFVLVGYYTMLIAWVIHAFFDSFASSNPWKDGADGDTAVGYFMGEIIGMSTVGESYCLRPTRVIWENFGYAALAWFMIFLCLAWGMKVTGYITYGTMGLPIILLFLFLGRAVTLPGAEDGIQKYIGEWDMSVLVNQPEVWSKAASQIFFSLGLTSGIMTAYGSHVDRNEPALLNSVVIACSNCMFSFIAGFAVFGAIGHLAYVEDKDFSEISYASFGLVFGTWPVVLNTLPGGIHWVRLLFVNFFLLGIDSAFSMVEALLCLLHDTIYFRNTSKKLLVGSFSIFACLLSMIYATDAGLFFLDAIDFYVNFVFLLLGLFETFGAGWVHGIEKSVDTIGSLPVFLFTFGNFGSVVLASGLWFGLKNVWSGFIGFILLYLACLGGAIYSISDPEMSIKTKFHELYLANILDFRKQLQPVVGACPIVWCLLIKHFIPHVLLILFINLASSEGEDGKPLFGNYEGYCAWPYQTLGILTMVFILLVILVGAARPTLYEPLHYVDFNPNENKVVDTERKGDEVDEEEQSVESPEKEQSVESPEKDNESFENETN